MKKLLSFIVILLFGTNSFSQSIPFNITSSLPIFYLDGAAFYYRATGINVTTTGTYTFMMDTGDNLDSWLILYNTFGFSQAHPLINGLIQNDDDEEGELGLGSRIVFTLEPGVYTLVGTTFSSLDQGSATLSVSGPGNIAFTSVPSIQQLMNYNITNDLPIFNLENTQRYHRDTGIRITTAGIYNIQLNTDNSLNSLAGISNTNGFNPAQPNTNLLATNDDDSIGLLGSGSRIAINLTPGDYVFVGTTAASLATGPATLAVTGPAPVTFIPPFSNATLPLHLLNFSVKAEKGAAQIRWTAVEDGDGGSYVLQRSTDGQHFVDKQTIAAGDKPLTRSYVTYDYQLPAGDNYYRLVIMNEDRTEDFSKIVKLNSGTDLAIETAVLPNPSVGSVHIYIKNMKVNSQEVSIQVTDISGRQLRSEKKSLNQHLDLVYPAVPGIYVVKVTSSDGTYNWTRQVTVQ